MLSINVKKNVYANAYMQAPELLLLKLSSYDWNTANFWIRWLRANGEEAEEPSDTKGIWQSNNKSYFRSDKQQKSKI